MSDVVIGGSGFIGRNLAGRLERAGREVVVIDRHPDATGVFGGRFIEGDAQDADWLAQTLGGLKVEDLYHLAANSDISAGVADASLDFGDTLMTTAAVHYALTRIPVQRLVFASSSAIFGVSDAPLSEVHDRAPAPVSWYGKAKLASEYVLESLASARYDLPILIVRFPNVVGPLATHGVVFDFVRRLRDDPTRLDVLGDGHQTKPYVHVSALLDGIDYFLDRSGPGVTRVNIGPPDQVDVRTIAQEVCACLGVEPAITFQESPFGWPGDVPRYAFDTSRMRAAGFDLQTSSRAAVRRAAGGTGPGVAGPMTLTAVILAGGKGTRSADPSRAKLAQIIGGRSLMAWHLAAIESIAGIEVDEVLVVAGHLGEQVQHLCDGLATSSRSIRVVHEARQEGTVAATRLAAQHTTADAFLVILGDVLMSLRLQDFLGQWQASEAGVAVAVHPSSHPQDSDTCFPADDGRVIVVPKGEPRDHVPNMSSAGLFAITRSALSTYGDLADLGSSVLSAAASSADLYAHVTSHYLKDTGTATRLADAQGDVERGAFARRGTLGRRPALFLDRDGVINPTEPEFYRPEQFELLPGVADAIAEANRIGIPVIVLTNQPHIAKGFMSFQDHQHVRARMDHLLHLGGAFVDDYFFCPHHPQPGFPGEVPELKVPCECRKPSVGMALAAAARHHIDLAASTMVGDTERDRAVSGALGMRYIHVDADASDTDAPHSFQEAADAIRRGIEELTC